jgi:hypothetical protein
LTFSDKINVTVDSIFEINWEKTIIGILKEIEKRNFEVLTELSKSF